ncbi:hypothetical protein BOX15_Mlig027432g1 [Macrostomum lignano]|uniref:Zinc transporter ZIP4 N-terminal domain-containing protein n=1 Tax=Macrostomum lignano TaxID=282301 RepID=A0A267H4L2_9PLAT|nr:hypothetical protein BOX15_Mlig027432g1 [Macrostomum lignano]
MTKKSTTVLAAMALLLCHLVPGSRAQSSTFLDAMWKNKLMLEANQTMTSDQFQSVLTDLRIGAKFNASRACARAPAAPAYKEANDSIADSCLSGAQIAESFRLNLTTGLNRDQFGSLAVAMVQQQLSGRCLIPAPAETEANSTKTVRDIKWVYIYGTISVTVISLLSCLGCLLVACHRAVCYRHMLLFLVELAVGSLVGEALLHLLPTVVQNGLHGGHGEHGEEEHHEEGGGVPENFVKLVAAAGTLCILHAIDTASVVAGVDNHGHDSEVPTEGQAYSVSTADAEAVEQVPSSATAARSEKPTTFGFIQQSQVSLRELFRKPKRCLSSPIRLCLFVMVSDALHNFADGVAIGAGFAIGDADGLRLSLSIGLHELAHELADFAVLLSCGFSVRGALAINLACTVTAYVGLYVAVPLADASTEAQVWILAVASGMFLYIALVTMTNLVRRSYRPKSKTAFFVGNLGLLCGFLSVIAISMYEFYG